MTNFPSPPPDEPGGSAIGYRPCVGVMILNREGLVWIGQRIDTPGENEGEGTWWQMPQGGIDAGEDPRTAALREVFEETGMRSLEILEELGDWLYYDLPPYLLGKAWGGRYRGQRQRWFAVRFLGPEAEINIDHPAHPEFKSWRWAPPSDVLMSVVPFKRAVYTEVLTRFRPLLGAPGA